MSNLHVVNGTPKRTTMKVLRGNLASKKLKRTFYKELMHYFEEVVEPAVLDNADLTQTLKTLSEQLSKLKSDVTRTKAKELASRWVRAVSKEDKQKLTKQLTKAIGVEQVFLQDGPLVTEVEQIMQEEALNLITSLPEEYYDKVYRATFDSYNNVDLPEGRSLTDEIKHISDVTRSRAKLIAEDQTNKLHSVITASRQTSLGITEYIWRTSRDSRVVGTPGGVSPKGNKTHGNHYIREGKRFRWDHPPFDGHPGWAIRCRCHAEPIIDYENLKLS